jgi:catalase (peroxidase I)
MFRDGGSSAHSGNFWRQSSSASHLDDVFFRLHRQKKKWKGPLQYEDKGTKELMMLPTDMELIWDKKFRPYVEEYAKDEEKFFAVSTRASLLCQLNLRIDT